MELTERCNPDSNPANQKPVKSSYVSPSCLTAQTIRANSTPAVWSEDDIAHGLLKFDIELVRSGNNLWSALGAYVTRNLPAK